MESLHFSKWEVYVFSVKQGPLNPELLKWISLKIPLLLAMAICFLERSLVNANTQHLITRGQYFTLLIRFLFSLQIKFAPKIAFLFPLLVFHAPCAIHWCVNVQVPASLNYFAVRSDHVFRKLAGSFILLQRRCGGAEARGETISIVFWMEHSAGKFYGKGFEAAVSLLV